MKIDAFIKSEMGQWMKHFALRNRRAITLVIHSLLMVAAYVLAFLIRFDGVIPEKYVGVMGRTLFLAVGCKLVVFQWFRLHHGVLRYAGMSDLLRLIKATTVSTLIFIALVQVFVVFILHLDSFPRSIFVLDWLTTLIFFGGSKMSVRLLSEMRHDGRQKKSGVSARTLIVGAGDAGELALRELKNNHALGHIVVGFLDDDRRKHGLEIHGIPVLDAVSEAPRLVEEEAIDEVLIAMPSAGRKAVQDIVDACSKLDVRLRILPAMSDLITGDISVQAIRDVQVEDLLCRQPVRFDSGEVRTDIAGRVVLVTGAAGSIGSEIARQVALYEPSNLVVLDNAETPLFDVLHELRASFPGREVTPVIGDVKDQDAVRRVFAEHTPDRVYHAAAYKHVPLMEAFPGQAVLNNVRGTRIVASTAREFGVGRFVMISSDKAVRPGNIMGASKRICELIVSSMNGQGTSFCAVRFGNVLGSNGSVIPIFKKQIEAGGPVTVTDPEMTRYFMTISEAVALVLQCGAMTVDNNVFVLDMGTPVKIMALAENMIRLSGLKLGEDIDIRVTGLRPGEKLHEELITHGEQVQKTNVPKINVLDHNGCRMAEDFLVHAALLLEEAAIAGNDDLIRKTIWGLISLDGEVCVDPGHPHNAERRLSTLTEWEKLMASHEPGPVGEKRRILIVDGDPRASHFAGEVLKQCGCIAVSVGLGAHALDLLTNEGETIDAVICADFLMDCGGDELLRMARSAGCKVPFVLARDVNGNGDVRDEEEGFACVLPKPFVYADVAKMCSAIC